MENNNRKEKAIPGDELAVIEEFEPGEGTYEVNGKIRASILGKINIFQTILIYFIYRQ